MPVELKLTVYGEYKGKKFSEPLVNFMTFRKFLGDWKPALEFIADDVLEPGVIAQFETEGAAGGESWQGLADATKKARGGPRALCENFPLLYVSGHLSRSFRKGESEHVEGITAKNLKWGSSVPYSLFHQTGTGKGFEKDSVATGKGADRGMPRRKILVVTKAMTNEMMTAFQLPAVAIPRDVGFAVTKKRGEAGIDAAEASAHRRNDFGPVGAIHELPLRELRWRGRKNSIRFFQSP